MCFVLVEAFLSFKTVTADSLVERLGHTLLMRLFQIHWNGTPEREAMEQQRYSCKYPRAHNCRSLQRAF